MMRAKMQVQSVTKYGDAQESLSMSAVTGTTQYGPQGENEDNTYARYTPSGSISLSITNPALIGKFRVGQRFYVDFTEAPE